MKSSTKYLVAALAGAGSSLAGAQSSVQLYGIADVSIGVTSRGDYQNVTSGTPPVTSRQSIGNTVRLDSGVQSSSRIGIRGTEDLGDGFKALFNAEAAWNADDGTGGASGGAVNFARKSIVGLSWPTWGTVALGRDYTPAWYAGAATDIGNYSYYGTDYAFAQLGGLSIRSSNAIEWQSPSWGGVTVRAMAGTGERDVAPKDQGNLYGASAIYRKGAITAAGYYQSLRVATVPASSDSRNQAQWGVGGGYDFGVARLAAGFGRNSLPGDGNHFDMWNIGAAVRLGAGELLGQFTKLKAGANRTGGLGGTAGQGSDAKIYMVAYTYPLSRRTNVYASVGTTHNSSTGGFGLYSNGTSLIPGAPGQTAKAAAFGLRHTF